MLATARASSAAFRLVQVQPCATRLAAAAPRPRFLAAAESRPAPAVPRASAPTSTATASTPLPLPDWPPTAQVAMLHDGDCPLCEREVKMLKARDASAGKIFFIDVADPRYEAETGPALGISYERAMRTIHAIERDGTIITGVAVFKRLYDLVGLGWVYGFMAVPPLRRAAEAVYNAWAAARLPITGRPTLEAVLAERKTCK